MKKALKSTIAGLLILALLTSFALAGGEPIMKSTLPLADNAALVSGTWQIRNADGETADLQEHYVTYTPSTELVPMVVYGSTLYGRSAMNVTVKYLQEQGLSMVAGINGSFFDLKNGIPIGLVVTDGVLRSSGNINSVGFFADGTAVIGKPELKLTLSTEHLGQTEIFYNKVLTASNGIGLYSNDYDYKTKNTLSAYNLVLRPTSGKAELSMNCTQDMEIIGVLESLASCPIPDECFVLSIADSSIYAMALENMKTLNIGETVTVSVSSDEAWANVRYACGGGDLLVEDGAACTDFMLDSAKTSRARTAVGILPDGSLIFYTADETEASCGLTLQQLAGRMLEFGCVTALNLDGGGSTALGVQYPGYASGATANTPSDGELRGCANYIYLVRSRHDAMSSAKLWIYPQPGTLVLPNAKLPLTVKATDDQYMAAELPEKASLTAVGGTVSADGTLSVAPNAERVSVSAKAGKLETENEYQVLKQLTALTVKKEGAATPLTSLHVASGSVTELTAAGFYYGLSVRAQDSSFNWTIAGDIGSVNETGTFTAAKAEKQVTGTISVSYGQTRVSIPVTVSPNDPFADVKGHWAESYINALYFDGVLTGSTGKDGKLYYRPGDSMTRQEFIVALMRFLGTDLSEYRNVVLPFIDNGYIAAWALDAVKAAYSLGYVGGSGSNGRLSVNPTSTITRQEAMAILARTMSGETAKNVSVLSRFTDASKISDWAKAPLALMVEKSIISGSNGCINPTGNVKRCEVAKMLYMMQEQ